MSYARINYAAFCFLIILILLAMTACNSLGGATSPSETIIINGRPLEKADTTLLIEDRYFIKLDVLKNFIDINPRLKHHGSLTHFVNLNELNIEEGLKSLFYNPKAVIFSLPLIKREGSEYLDVKYLVDFYAFTKLELGPKLVLFSPDYDRLPNRVGLLKRGAPVKSEDGKQDFKLGQGLEVYFFEDEGAEEVLFYSSGLDPSLCKLRDIDYVAEFSKDVIRLDAKVPKSRYNSLIMAFDDIDFYGSSVGLAPSLKFEGLSTLLPRVLSLDRGRLLSIQDASYMEAALNLGVDVIPVLDILVDEELTRLLKDDFSVKSTIDSLLLHALYYGYSGLDINVINLRDGDIEPLSSYLSRLSNKYKAAGLSLLFNLYPDRPNLYKLGLSPPFNTAVDAYIGMFMDEATGREKALPAQRPAWVEAKLLELLEELPPEKLILAQGLYLRSYEFGPSGGLSLSQSVFPYSEFYAKTDGLIMETKRDEELDQVYYKYKNPDTRGYFELWMDDEKSFIRKFRLVKHHNLQGLALWTYSMMDENIIDMIKKAMDSK